MRDFFIIGLEYIIHVVVVLLLIFLFLGTTLTALSVWSLPVVFPGGVGSTGPLAAIAFFFLAGLQIMLFAGFLYLGIGIYQNTRRMALALENRLMP